METKRCQLKAFSYIWGKITVSQNGDGDPNICPWMRLPYSARSLINTSGLTGISQGNLAKMEQLTEDKLCLPWLFKRTAEISYISRKCTCWPIATAKPKHLLPKVMEGTEPTRALCCFFEATDPPLHFWISARSDLLLKSVASTLCIPLLMFQLHLII